MLISFVPLQVLVLISEALAGLTVTDADGLRLPYILVQTYRAPQSIESCIWAAGGAINRRKEAAPPPALAPTGSKLRMREPATYFFFRAMRLT